MSPTPGSCCGHALNLHAGAGRNRYLNPCLACKCAAFVPKEENRMASYVLPPMGDPGPEFGKVEPPYEGHTVGVARRDQVGGEHYRKFKIQPWDVIDAYDLSFYAGNALKYLLRAGHKGAALEDLKKCRHYLDKLIEMEEGTDGH